VGFSPTSGGTLMKSIFQRLGISMLILLIAASFMTQTLVKIVAERKQDNEIRTVLSEQLSTVAGARLSDIKLDQGSAGLQVIATVTTTQEFEPSQVARWEDVLQARIDPGARLIVRTVLSKDIDRSGLVFMSQEDLIRHHQISEESRYMNEVSRVVSSYIQTVAGAQVTDVSKTSPEKGAQITITVRTPTAMTPSQVQQLQDRLRQDVDEEIVLVVRSVLTTDADAEGFMHMPLDFTATLEGEDQELYRRLTNEVAWYLGQQVEGVKLERLRFDYLGENAIRVEATVRTPLTIGPALVAGLQTHLIQQIDPRIILVIRSQVGGTATAEELFQDSSN